MTFGQEPTCLLILICSCVWRCLGRSWKFIGGPGWNVHQWWHLWWLEAIEFKSRLFCLDNTGIACCIFWGCTSTFSFAFCGGLKDFLYVMGGFRSLIKPITCIFNNLRCWDPSACSEVLCSLCIPHLWQLVEESCWNMYPIKRASLGALAKWHLMKHRLRHASVPVFVSAPEEQQENDFTETMDQNSKP